MLHRSMTRHPATVRVLTLRYSGFDPDGWWKDRAGVWIAIVELQRLVLDVFTGRAPAQPVAGSARRPRIATSFAALLRTPDCESRRKMPRLNKPGLVSDVVGTFMGRDAISLLASSLKLGGDDSV